MKSLSLKSIQRRRLAALNQCTDPNSGFSLIELLITVAIGSLIFSAGATLVTSHIRSSTKAEIGQRIRDDSNRLGYFIQTEANESALVRTGQPLSGCSVSGNSIFSFDIPLPTGLAGDPTNVVRTYYYQNGSDLRRCGPSINRNGSLNYATIQDYVLNTNTTLVLTPCNGISTANPGRAVAYQVTFNDAPGGVTPPCSVARAKSFFVVDP